jgi:hypothetical protein
MAPPLSPQSLDFKIDDRRIRIVSHNPVPLTMLADKLLLQTRR